MRFARAFCLVFFGFLLFAGQSALAGPGAAPPPASAYEVDTSSQPPQTDQAYHLPPDKLEKSKTLNKIRLALDVVGTLWGLAILWLLLATRWAARISAWTRRLTARRWIQGLLFFVVFLLISFFAALPLDAIGHTTSVHYGISVQHWPSWLGDQAKGLGLTLGIVTWLLLFFNWLVRVSPRRYWLWTWAACVPLILIGTFITPVLIDPIFNKFEPLMQTHPELVGRLEQVVTRTGTQIPPGRMFLMKASAKTNGLNAYVTGIGSTKRFVMWDTTTDRMPDDEILFIFGHESGHYVLHHIAKGLTVGIVGMFFGFWICARAGEWLVLRFGSRWGADSVASRPGFLALLFVLSIGGFLATPAANAFSRHIEHEADVYGQEAVHGLVVDPQKTAVSAFNHLGEVYLEDPDPSPIVEFWEYNHPSVQSRATFAQHYDPWKNGGQGRFFK
jgi:Zn-dependent protease with chaperone function